MLPNLLLPMLVPSVVTQPEPWTTASEMDTRHIWIHEYTLLFISSDFSNSNSKPNKIRGLFPAIVMDSKLCTWHSSYNDLGPFSYHGLTLIPAWIINYMSCESIHSQTSTVEKHQRLHNWSLGIDKQFHLRLYNGCYNLTMLGLKLNHVNKGGPWDRSGKPCANILTRGSRQACQSVAARIQMSMTQF